MKKLGAVPRRSKSDATCNASSDLSCRLLLKFGERQQFWSVPFESGAGNKETFFLNEAPQPTYVGGLGSERNGQRSFEQPSISPVVMSEESKDIKRWTARRKAEVVTEIIKGKTTASEIARTHDLTIGEIEQWKSDFIDMGTEALLSHPRDAEATHILTRP
jgi:hypothetical protein